LSASVSGAKIGVLERNRVVGQRIARVMAAACGLIDVACAEDPADLRAALDPDPLLLGCDAADLELALDWATNRYPGVRLLVWTSGETQAVIEAARKEARIASVLGWPSFESMPRPWEIAFAVRRLLKPEAPSPRLADLLGWGATVLKWRPRTSEERDVAVGEVSQYAERAGAPTRIAEKLGELAHELLMNAMYDAPVDARGRPRYAHDRKSEIYLLEHEVPTLRLGTDGEQIALQAVDPFGRLRRHHVLDGIARGLGARGNGARAQVLDTSGGGAGLGMLKIYTAGTVLMVDVSRAASTCVTSFYDLDVNPREFRSLPASVHFFERPERAEDAREQSAG
jgi:hypothetical protein